MDPPTNYKSYLLRLRRSTRDGQRVWRVSLQNIDTGQRQGFPDLESLFTYLETPATDDKTTPESKNKPILF